jgi:ribonuclease HI
MPSLVAFVDGACRLTNPGLAASSYVVYDEGCRELETHAFVHPGLVTNNFAEYMGLVALLIRAEIAGWKGAAIYSDSSLVVNQCTGGWAVSSKFSSLAQTAQGLLIRGGHKLYHMRGHEKDPRKGLHRGNNRADELCNKVLDEFQAKEGKNGD